jgi:hypothetical protein
MESFVCIQALLGDLNTDYTVGLKSSTLYRIDQFRYEEKQDQRLPAQDYISKVREVMATVSMSG